MGSPDHLAGGTIGASFLPAMPTTSPTPQDQPLINACPSCGQHIDVSELEPYSKILCGGCQDTIRVRTGFHHFMIREQIGIGGMSRVFRATDTALKRDVALKILNRHCSNDARRVEQFEREARITAAISHPNVVKVYSAGWDQGYFYIAMELVRGGSLEEKIRSEKSLSEARVLAIAVETARGLKAAQQAGLIHRDIKPGNILFADDGTAKIVDFGLALMIQSTPQADKELWATPFYVPPEKLEGGVEDHRSDLYSLGASLFHAALGRPPCSTDTNSLVELRALKSITVKLTNQEATQVSPELKALLERTLRKNPADRYATYDEFIKHSEYALQHPGKSLPRLARRDSRAGMIAASVIGALIMGGGLTLWLKKPEPKSSDGGLQIVSDPTASGDQSISAQYSKARDAMFRGELPEARESFLNLAKLAPQPTSHWSTFNAGLCALLEGDETRSREIFSQLSSYGSDPLSKFFGEMRTLCGGTAPVQAEQLVWVQPDSYSTMAWRALGLKNWQMGEWRGAKSLMEKFANSKPAPTASWVGNYHGLISPHLEDLHQLQDWPDMSLGGVTGAQATARLKSAKLAVGKLRLSSPVKAACEQEIAQYSKGLEPLLEREKSAEELAMKELLAKETQQMQDLLREAAADAKTLKFPAAITRLHGLQVKSESLKAQLQDELSLWRDAEDFVQQMIKDFASTSQEIELARFDSPPQRGRVLSASRDGIHFQVSGVSGDALIAWSQIQPLQLIRMAEAPLEDERITDSDEYYHRRQMIVAFALKANLQNYGSLRGDELARENRNFSKLWERMQSHLQGVPR